LSERLSDVSKNMALYIDEVDRLVEEQKTEILTVKK
jgi:hypothetical protein